jgi:Relaxase/Mobilisation nuclease domain
MIVKISRGGSFGGLLNYLSKSEPDIYMNVPDDQDHQPVAEMIGGNMCGRTRNELVKEFRVSRQMNSNCKKPVFHVSLTLPLGEKLGKDIWNELAQEYMERMGFTDNQYAVFRHRDTDYDHIHIIASAIQLGDGKVVDSSFDYLKSMKITRALEKEYGLQQVEQKTIPRMVDRALNKRIDRQQKEYEAGRRDAPPEVPVKYRLQEQIEKAAEGQPSMSDLVERLMVAGIEVKHGTTRTGKSKGISYQLDKVACSGTQLGGAYTWQGLQQHLGVSYEPERDEPVIQRLTKSGVLEVQKQYHQKLSEKIDQQTDRIQEQVERMNQQLVNQKLIDQYRSIDLNELWEWCGKAVKLGRSDEYLERIKEATQTLRDWREDRSVGWDEVQKLDLDEMWRNMETDKEEYQKSVIVPEQVKSKAPKVEIQIERSTEKPQKSQSRGMSR